MISAVMESSPWSGSGLSMEPTWDSLSFSLSALPAHVCILSISLKSKIKCQAKDRHAICAHWATKHKDLRLGEHVTDRDIDHSWSYGSRWDLSPGQPYSRGRRWCSWQLPVFKGLAKQTVKRSSEKEEEQQVKNFNEPCLWGFLQMLLSWHTNHQKQWYNLISQFGPVLWI